MREIRNVVLVGLAALKVALASESEAFEFGPCVAFGKDADKGLDPRALEPITHATSDDGLDLVGREQREPGIEMRDRDAYGGRFVRFR